MSQFVFKYSLGQKVTDPLGNIGIVKMLGVDEGGVQYHVQFSSNSNWWLEDQLADYDASSEFSGVISNLNLLPKFEILRFDTVQTISFECADAVNAAANALRLQGVEFDVYAFPSADGEWYLAKTEQPGELP